MLGKLALDGIALLVPLVEESIELGEVFLVVRQQKRLYERLGPPVAMEILNWRVVSSGPRPDLSLRIMSEAAGHALDARKGERPAYFPEAGDFVATPIYDRYRLAPGAAFVGPAIVEERESTAIVGPAARCRIDDQQNLVVELR